MIDPTKTYQTRDGRKVLRILCTDAPGTYPIVALVEVLGGGMETARAVHYTAEGKLVDQKSALHGWDLIETPKKYEGWVNVYPPTVPHNTQAKEQISVLHATRTEADRYAGLSRLACLHISFTEGEGLMGEAR